MLLVSIWENASYLALYGGSGMYFGFRKRVPGWSETVVPITRPKTAALRALLVLSLCHFHCRPPANGKTEIDPKVLHFPQKIRGKHGKKLPSPLSFKRIPDFAGSKAAA